MLMPHLTHRGSGSADTSPGAFRRVGLSFFGYLTGTPENHIFDHVEHSVGTHATGT